MKNCFQNDNSDLKIMLANLMTLYGLVKDFGKKHIFGFRCSLNETTNFQVFHWIKLIAESSFGRIAMETFIKMSTFKISCIRCICYVQRKSSSVDLFFFFFRLNLFFCLRNNGEIVSCFSTAFHSVSISVSVSRVIVDIKKKQKRLLAIY